MLTWDYMVRYREAYENEMEYFIDMMTEGKPSPTKRNEILGTMKVIDAILLSMKEKRVVNIQEVL